MGFLEEIGTREQARPGAEGPSGRRAWLVLLMIVLLAGAAYVALHRYAEHRVPLGTSIEGVGIGGMDATAAADRLAAELGPRLSRPVTVTHGDRGYRFDPAASGMRLDPAGTLRAAGVASSPWRPAALWHFLTGGHELQAVVRVQEQRFTQALDALTARIGRPLVEGDVRFVDGHARAVLGRAGLTVDHARTQALVARLAFEGHPGELPLTTRQPYVPPAAVLSALRGIARPAMAAPVVIDLDGHRVRVPPSVLGQALDMVPSRRRLVLLVDADHLADLVVARDRTLGPKPVPATVVLRGGRPVIVPAVDGVTFDHQQLAAGLPAVLRRPPGHRMLSVHAVLQQPRRTTATVRGWQVHRLLSTVTIADAGLAAGRLDGAVVAPGGTLRLGARLGHPDRALATALFTAALHGGLSIADSTVPTSYDDRLPVGLQRTDVTLTAPPGTGVLIGLTAQGSVVRLVLWGAAAPPVRLHLGPRRAVVPASVRLSSARRCTPRAGVPGFSVTLIRHIRGRSPEHYESTYAPVPALRCVPPPAPPAASGSGAPR